MIHPVHFVNRKNVNDLPENKTRFHDKHPSHTNKNVYNYLLRNYIHQIIPKGITINKVRNGNTF